MAEVSLGALLARKNVPESGTKREQIEYIDIDRIDSDPGNFYQLSKLDELAANIELVGLQQPIRVRAGENGRVVIVSGHRRMAAIRTLAKEAPEKWSQIPCIREQEEGSPALQKLRLIYANQDTRKISDADLAKQAAEVEMLLYQLQEEGYNFPGRMRDHVAQACKISKSKLSRLKVIENGLVQVWRYLWEKNQLAEQTAYALARMPGEFQERLFKATNAKVTGNGIERILGKYEKGWRWETTLTCPSGKSCTHADAALKHDMDNYDMCGGNRCCLTCPQATRDWSPCERMCARAKEQRKEAKEAEKEKRDNEERKRITAHEKTTQKHAQRLLPALENSDLPNKTLILWDSYGRGFSVGDVRKMAAGDFTGNCVTYRALLDPNEFRFLPKSAGLLKCSTDFILGLNDKPILDAAETQQEDWGWGNPEESGLYWCVTGPMRGGGKLYWWNNDEERWEAADVECELNARPICWMKCPELPESASWNRQTLED